MRTTNNDGSSWGWIVKRYASIYWALWRNSVVREMGFKVNFLLWIVVEMIWFVLHLTFIHVMYLHTDTIGSWTKWQVVALMGTSHLIQQVFTALFFNNCAQLSEHVRTGRLDFILLLPASPRFLLSLRHVDLGSFVNAGSALAVVSYSMWRMEFVPAWWQVGMYFVLCGVGVIAHYALMFSMASVSFWTVRAQGIVWGYYNLFTIARIPDEAFRGMFKSVFTFVLPMLLVSNVPVRVLLGRIESWTSILLLILVTCVCLWMSHLMWKISVRRYTSASS